MTHQEAIYVLKALKRVTTQRNVYEALEVACKALAISGEFTYTDSNNGE